MHRVFRPGAFSFPTAPVAALDDLRAFLRSLGLVEVEEAAFASWLYLWHEEGAPDAPRTFATLHGGRGSFATVYLYPDALGRERGVATRFYLTLDEAGLQMGSKLGPSIGIDLDDAEHLRLFREGLAEIFEAVGSRE